MPHTPGPWHRSSGPVSAILAQDGRRVATFQDCCASTDVYDEIANALANGRLIAAAPDLLSACEHALAHFGRLMDSGALTREEEQALAELRAAVAKAKGA